MTGSPQALPRLSGDGADRLAEGDHRIVVTGAGGWLGQATLELLGQSLGASFNQRVVCYGSHERSLSLRGGRVVSQLALSDIRGMPERPTLVLHLAYLTKDRALQMSGAEYAAANRAISRQVLDALEPIGACAAFLASSGAAYSVCNPSADEATRLYGQLKQEDEAAFAAWGQRSGRSVAIARVFNLSGPYVNKLHAYALSAFILDALAGRPIEIRATRPVHRSYVAIRELMSVVFATLLEGDGVTQFDTAGDRDYEMAEIARVVCTALQRGDLPIHRSQMGDSTADVYVGDGTLYSKLRSSHGVEAVDFPNQVRETAAYLAEVATQI